MSYRNPGIIRDRTADVYVQASKDLTNIFIKGIEAKGARLAAEADEKKKDDERWRLNANKNSRVIRKQNKTTGDFINTIDGNLTDSYQDNIEILGNPALTALTDNETKTDLSVEQRQANDDIYAKYENYNTTTQTLGGLFKAELNEHYGEKDGEVGLSSSSIGLDWNYVGDNNGERVGNMFIINALNNTDAASNYGGTMSKTGGYDEKGNSNATFVTKIPSDNKEFLKFRPEFKRGDMDDKEWSLHKEFNGIVEENGQFVFRRVINNENFGEGFVRKTMAGPSAEDMLVKPGLVTEKGGIPNEAFITDKLNAQVQSISSSKGGRKTTKTNTRRYFNNNFYVGKSSANWQTALSKATALTGQNNTRDINDYLRNRLDITNPEEVMNEGVYDPNLIAKAMQMKVQRDGLKEYSNKIADEKDVAYYKSLGIDIAIRERIYFEESNPSEVFDATPPPAETADPLGYVKNRINSLINIEIPKTSTFGDTSSSSYKKNIETLSKSLGKKTNAMGKTAAIKVQKETYDELLNKYGETNKDVIDAKATLDEIESGDSKALWIIKGDKANRVEDYNPNDITSNLEILLEYGDQLSAKEKSYLKSEIQRIRIEQDPFNVD